MTKNGALTAIDILDATQPIVNKAKLAVANGGSGTTAVVVTYIVVATISI